MVVNNKTYITFDKQIIFFNKFYIWLKKYIRGITKTITKFYVDKKSDKLTKNSPKKTLNESYLWKLF